jgi:hypothetical protein
LRAAGRALGETHILAGLRGTRLVCVDNLPAVFTPTSDLRNRWPRDFASASNNVLYRCCDDDSSDLLHYKGAEALLRLFEDRRPETGFHVRTPVGAAELGSN